MINVYIVNFLYAIITGVFMSIIPIVCIDILALSYLQYGLLEGFTEFCGNTSRILIGNIYDRAKRKNRLFLVSAFLNISLLICLKILSSSAIVLSKIFERVGNGTFAVQRDAHITNNTVNRSIALALLLSTKAVGIVFGTAIVSYTSYKYNNLNISNINNITNLLIIFSFVALILILLLVKKENVVSKKTETFDIKDVGNVITKAYPILLLAFLYFLSRFNDGVIINFLRIMDYPSWYYNSTIGIFNTIMIFVSIVIGVIAKKYINFCLLLVGSSMLAFNTIFFNLNKNNLLIASLGLFCWGVQRCGSQIVFESLLIDSLDNEKHSATKKKYAGTAIGIYYVFIGIGGLIASTLTGHLISTNYLQAFLYSGFISSIFLFVSLLCLGRWKKKK